jgi:hypothetical protein
MAPIVEMNEREPGTEAVECAEVVYRALRKAWAQGERIASAAFMRRISGLDAEDGVLLSRRKYTTARDCRLKLKGLVRSASLHVGKIRGLPLGLDVVPDPDRDRDGTITDPGHCLLINLPHPVNEEEAAEVAASQLIKIARFVTPEQEEQEHTDRCGRTRNT